MPQEIFNVAQKAVTLRDFVQGQRALIMSGREFCEPVEGLTYAHLDALLEAIEKQANELVGPTGLLEIRSANLMAIKPGGTT